MQGWSWLCFPLRIGTALVVFWRLVSSFCSASFWLFVAYLFWDYENVFGSTSVFLCRISPCGYGYRSLLVHFQTENAQISQHWVDSRHLDKCNGYQDVGITGWGKLGADYVSRFKYASMWSPISFWDCLVTHIHVAVSVPNLTYRNSVEPYQHSYYYTLNCLDEWQCFRTVIIRRTMLKHIRTMSRIQILMHSHHIPSQVVPALNPFKHMVLGMECREWSLQGFNI